MDGDQDAAGDVDNEAAFFRIISEWGWFERARIQGGALDAADLLHGNDGGHGRDAGDEDMVRIRAAAGEDEFGALRGFACICYLAGGVDEPAGGGEAQEGVSLGLFVKRGED